MSIKRSAAFPWIVCGLGGFFIVMNIFCDFYQRHDTRFAKNVHYQWRCFWYLVAFYYYAYTPMQLPVGT